MFARCFPLSALRRLGPGVALLLLASVVVLPGGCPTTDTNACTEQLNQMQELLADAQAALDECQANEAETCPAFCTKLADVRTLFDELTQGGCLDNSGLTTATENLRTSLEALEAASGDICPSSGV